MINGEGIYKKVKLMEIAAAAVTIICAAAFVAMVIYIALI